MPYGTKNLRAALTEHQKGLLEQLEKAEAEISDIQITLNGEFRTHIDCCDESGDITDRHAEIWYSTDCKSMAEC